MKFIELCAQVYIRIEQDAWTRTVAASTGKPMGHLNYNHETYDLLNKIWYWGLKQWGTEQWPRTEYRIRENYDYKHQ